FRKVIDSDGWSIVLLTPTNIIRLSKLSGIMGTISVCFIIIILWSIIHYTDRSHEAIKQIEESRRLLLHAAGEGIFGVDARGQLNFANPAALRMLGFTEKELLGQKMHALIHHHHKDGSIYPEEDCPMYASYTGAVESHMIEEVLWRRDGSSFPAEYSSMPITMGGKTIGAVVTIRDITERKKAEEVLAERRKFAELSADVGSIWIQGKELHTALQSCAEAIVNHLDAAFARIWMLNQEENVLELKASAGMYTHLNGAHGRVPVGKFKIGLIAEELKPHLTNDVIGDPRVGDQEWARQEGMVSFAGYPLMIEGRLFGVMAMFSRHRLSEVTLDALRVIADRIAIGISRQQMEKALLDREKEFRNLLEEAPLAIIVINKADEIELINSKNFEIIGYTRDETPTLEEWWSLAYPDPEERKKVSTRWDMIRQRVLSGENIGKKEKKIACKDGTKKDMEISYSRAGEKIIAIFNDITERKKAEEERERLILELKTVIASVKTLSGMLPICAACKKIRDDRGYWKQVENYVSEHTEAVFTSGICPDCEKKMYEEIEKLKKEIM
ncbi:MAG TPA: PAS domain S-box protein, partial [Thermodesulfovibrionales bacterium]|nr:PAS domain S-box protein [Thermodesulfovibrionales bacterium]